ncbi:MAG: diphosphate--fructose-6-phosphate 1-phosphotransferase [Spirochaetales bacterium]|nr:diphosphate--fructose-6-phosphate 1-phosphotransferase [Spirochaetales bacterium]
MRKNVLVAQSGGPSPVINASLAGVIEGCHHFPDKFGRILAGWHGVEGILTEELLDLDAQNPEELKYLKHTPASGFIGTCRYKLHEEHEQEFQRILDVFRAHDIGYFFYIGGNDSMDTAHKISLLARSENYELISVGIPKTIDNDLGTDLVNEQGSIHSPLIDHTPGYGSTARYWATLAQIANQENQAICGSNPVSVFQAMGRTAGFIPAAARLSDPERNIPMQLYLAETDHSLESMADNVNQKLKEAGRCIVIVSEGFDTGALGAVHDRFGHIDYGASESTVAQRVVNHLNKSGLAVRGKAEGQIPGILQRSTSLYTSAVDLEEAYNVALKSVELAGKGEDGYMATILRNPGDEYSVFYDKVPLVEVANSERQLPSSWITDDGLDVTDDFIKYARPLIGKEPPHIFFENGLHRFARLNPVFIEPKLPVFELRE